jgi:hypothetical protein
MITVAHVAMVVPEGANSDAAIEGVRANSSGFSVLTWDRSGDFLAFPFVLMLTTNEGCEREGKYYH